MRNRFVKSHGLGNDYLVFDSDNISFPVNANTVKILCDVHYGIGSDGLLLKVAAKISDFKVRMFNPDGSEFEKSGNGLRIFSKYLYDYDHADSKSFSIETKGGMVLSEIKTQKNGKATIIRIDMGKAEFSTTKIPVNLNISECIKESLIIDDNDFIINCVSLGNPHCVVIKDKLDIDEIMKFGPLIEKHGLFPNRTNVQFVSTQDRSNAEILIWERGVGFTNASGSSSCAVAAVLKKLDLVDNSVTIKMPGGTMDIDLDDNYNIKMTGVVQQIADGYLSQELVEILNTY